jgi:hypothetical protein
MHRVARTCSLTIAGLCLSATLSTTPAAAQQPARPLAPPPSATAEQGKPSTTNKAPPAVQVAPRTAADTARALREPLDTIRVDAQPAGKPPEELAVEPGPPWRISYFPYLTGAAGDIMLAARVRPWLPAAFEDRVTYRAALSLDGGAGIHGSWFTTVRFDAPLLWPGWRLVTVVEESQANRLGFYGFGNNSERDLSLRDSTQPNYFRVQRVAFDAYSDLSRRLISRLFVAGRIAVDHARFSALPGPSVFETQYGTEVEATDVNGRVALVWDSRSNEFNPRTGLLIEAGAQRGRSSGASYTRLYTVMRGYVPLRPATVAAARFGASNMTGTPGFNSRFEIPTWEDPMEVYGGYTSNRGYAGGRFVGSGVVFGSLELRQDFLPIGELASGMLIAFVDAGRVFEGESFTLDGRKLHVAAGLGLGARLLRSTIFTANLAKGSEGWRVTAGASWAF